MSLRALFLASALSLLQACAPAAPSGPAAPEGPTASASAPPTALLASSFVPIPPDRDGDGIPDSRDECPALAEDCDGFEDDDGCPDLDDDRDGIADVCDRCPREPGEPPDGCPRKVTIEVQTIRIVMHPQFGRGSDLIKPESMPILDEVANVLKANPQIELLSVVGHSSLDEGKGTGLSERRAQRVRDALVSRGVEPFRLIIKGMGSTQPIDSNATEPGRMRNRRVDWQIINMKQATSPPVPVTPPASGPRPIGPPTCPGLASVPPTPLPPPGGCPREPIRP